MSAWSDLSNAQHIDRVLASLKEHPEIWAETGGTDRSAAFRNTAWVAICDSARSDVWNEARLAARDAARLATPDATCDAAWCAAFETAYDAILALFVYDDCDQYLNMTSEELKVWSLLTEQPAAVLLLPAVIAFDRIKELESV
jgi:hypothetical protein